MGVYKRQRIGGRYFLGYTSKHISNVMNDLQSFHIEGRGVGDKARVVLRMIAPRLTLRPPLGIIAGRDIVGA